MSKLKDRLVLAAAGADPDYTALADYVGTSRQAVMKWFGIPRQTKDLRMDHLFKVAEFFQVDPRWLATGEGAMKPAHKAAGRPPLPRKDLALIEAFNRLPPEVAFHIRGQIESLDVILSKNYQTWSREEAERVANRRATITEISKPLEQVQRERAEAKK